MAYLTSKSSPTGTNLATWYGKLPFFGLYEFGGVIGEKIENLPLKPDYETVLDLKHICFINYGP